VDVAVVVLQIRVVVHGLKAWLPAVVLGKHACQRGLAAPDISCYRNMHVLKYKKIKCYALSYTTFMRRLPISSAASIVAASL
jgi:hypothetical protein